MSSTAVEPASHVIKEMLRLLKRGYTLAPASGSKFKIIDPDGDDVRRPDGRVFKLPNTPRPTHAKRYWEEMEALGLLREKGASRARVNGNGLSVTHDAEQALRAQARKAASDSLRTRLVTHAERLGGIEADGMQADLSHVAWYLAEKQGAITLPSTTDSMDAAINHLIHGGVVGDNFQAMIGLVLDELDRAPDLTRRFYQLVREARGLPERIVGLVGGDEAIGEWPFEVKLLRVDELMVDHTYQRPARRSQVRKMATSFDPTLVGTLDVNRRQNGNYAIMDGQQRYQAMCLLGKSTVYCSVYALKDRAAEARFFHHKNRDRAAIAPYYDFRARLIGGDERVTLINAIVENAGWKVSTRSDDQTEIGAVRVLERAFALSAPHRDECLSPALHFIGTHWRGRRYCTDADIIIGMARFHQLYLREEYDEEHLIRVLRDVGPSDILAWSRDFSTGRSRGMGTGMNVVNGIVTVYNNALPKNARNERKLTEKEPPNRVGIARSAKGWQTRRQGVAR